MVRVPRGLHSPAGAYAPGLFRWGPSAQPIRRLPVHLYRPVRAIPLQPSNGQAVVAGGAAVGGPALVQSATGTITSGTTATLTLGAGTTAGNCLVLYVGEWQATTNPVVSGVTLGGSADHWAAAVTAINNTFANAEIWADPNCAGAQTSVVVTFTAGTGTLQGQTLQVEEWSKVVTVSPVDKTSSNNNIGTSWSSGTTGVPVQAVELVVGAGVASGNAGTVITGPGAPWINTSQLSIADTQMMAGHLVTTTALAQVYSGGFSINSTYGAVVATLKAAVAPVSGAVPGTATVQLGPAGLGNIWYPAQVTLSTTTGITTGLDTSVCNLYLGPAGNATTLLGTVFGGNGIVAAALPNIQPGMYLIAQWTGAVPGDVASMNISGSMDALA